MDTLRVPVAAQQKQIRWVFMKIQVLSLALLRRWRIRLCQELQHRLQTWLGSSIAVDVNSTPSLRTSICCGYTPKKKKKKKTPPIWLHVKFSISCRKIYNCIPIKILLLGSFLYWWKKARKQKSSIFLDTSLKFCCGWSNLEKGFTNC